MTQTYSLNLIPGSVPVFVHVKQYDTAPREIVFKLYSGDTVYSIPSNTTITVSGTKPDGNGFSYNVTDFSTGGSTVTVPMQEQMTVLSGEIPCQLTIAQTGGIIGTATFILDVAPAALSDDVPVSETDLAMFQELAAQTQTEAAGVAGATAQIAQNTSNIATNTAAIAQLNSNLDGDTSWKTLVSGVEYRKVAGIVFVRAYTNDASISTTYSTVGTLPSGYRPNTMMYAVAGNNGTSGFGVAYINSSGVIGIKTQSATATSYWFQFAFPV